MSGETRAQVVTACRGLKANLIDRSGARRLPIGDDGFETAIERSLLVDKTLLIADVLDASSKCTLFCRPRRFGKTLNMTMLKSYLEIPPDGASRASLFEHLDIWNAGGGAYRVHQGTYPVVFVSFNAAKRDSWADELSVMRHLIQSEYDRHGYLVESPRLSRMERDYAARVLDGSASDSDLSVSLSMLTRMLHKHYGRRAIVLIDEYDAPVMAGFSASHGGYYREVVSFMKTWLTGALKDGGNALAFACLTGVQRIMKESIFSDLNNLRVDTALSTDYDERFGFTEDEVAALARYLNREDCLDEARTWYDGYRFGTAGIYNPWSVLNYFEQGGAPDLYWGNTSDNSVVGDLLRSAGADTLGKVYDLLRPNGSVSAPLDLGSVFPDKGGAQLSSGALWSMLYLSGYLTTDDTAMPNNARVVRRLRIPNFEVSELYRAEVVERFTGVAGGSDRLLALHSALVAGDENAVQSELSHVLEDSASSFDVTSENSVHMLLLGLLFGMPGYGDPLSNREAGRGRADIRIEPVDSVFTMPARPRITIEVKYEREASDELLASRARAALMQIADRAYDASPLPDSARGRIRWGIAACGKRVSVACERVESV